MIDKFIRKEILDPYKVRTMCINNNFYTMGTCAEYEHLFQLCEEYNGEVDKLVEIANDIINHSSSDVMFYEVFEPTCSMVEITIGLMNMLVRECERVDFELKKE